MTLLFVPQAPAGPGPLGQLGSQALELPVKGQLSPLTSPAPVYSGVVWKPYGCCLDAQDSHKPGKVLLASTPSTFSRWIADPGGFCTCLERKVSGEEMFRQLITLYLLSKNG